VVLHNTQIANGEVVERARNNIYHVTNRG